MNQLTGRQVRRPFGSQLGIVIDALVSIGNCGRICGAHSDLVSNSIRQVVMHVAVVKSQRIGRSRRVAADVRMQVHVAAAEAERLF